MLTTDEKYMKQALTQARKAMAIGEVPIGCVIVHDGTVIGRGYNRRNTDHSTLSHAEITAIRKASRRLGDWRLEGCTLYCTLEPCPMCAGAIEQARIDRVVIGAASDKSGCAGSLLNIVANEKLMHQSEILILLRRFSGIPRAFCFEDVYDEFYGSYKLPPLPAKLRRKPQGRRAWLLRSSGDHPRCPRRTAIL